MDDYISSTGLHLLIYIFTHLSNHLFIYLSSYLPIYLFSVSHHIWYVCIGYIVMGSQEGRGNQYMQLLKVLCCKPLASDKETSSFPTCGLTKVKIMQYYALTTHIVYMSISSNQASI